MNPAVVARYRAAFEADAGGHARAFAAARAGTWGEAVPVLPRPLFLGAPLRRAMEAATAAMTAALRAIAADHFRDGRHAAHVVLPPGAEALMAIDAGRADPVAFWRFDFLVDHAGGRLAFLELNGGDPSGLGYNEEFVAAFEGLAPLQQLRASVPMAADPLMARHRAVVTRRFGAFEGPLVFLAADDSTVRRDHEAMAADYRRAGWDALVADPRAIATRDDGGLAVAGRPVEAFVRDTIEELVFPPFHEAGARLGRAVAAGRARVLNPFCSHLGDCKGLFALLSEAGEPAWAEATRHVPWTRHPAPALLPMLRARRRRLVLKPVDGYGGHGVFLGPAATDAAWAAALDEAAAEPRRWIVQAYRPLPVATFPAFDGDAYMGFRRRFVTLSAWVMDGEVVGAFARAGDDRVVNVHQGGGMQPVYWLLDERDA